MSPGEPIEEYEMVENPQSLESLQFLNTEDSPIDSDSESVTSAIFEELDTRKSTDKTFHLDDTFQEVLAHYRGKKSSRLYIFICTGALAVWILMLIMYANTSTLPSIRWQTSIQMGGDNVTLSTYSPSRQNITINHLFNGDLSPTFRYVKWLEKRQYPKDMGGNGFYLTTGPQGMWIVKNTETTESGVLVPSVQFAHENNFFYVEDVILNPAKAVNDNCFHIVRSDVVNQWRHLTFALYWLFNPLTAEYTPIQPKDTGDKLTGNRLFRLHFAQFSPDGEKVLFGYDHDLFILDTKDMSVNQITSTGSKDIFNGKPDWVYEEEILSSDRMFWWSPSGNDLIYGSLNDTGVFEYEIDYYVKDEKEIGLTYELDKSDSTKDGVSQYPIKKKYKYPKPGTKNPVMTLYHYDFVESVLKKINIRNEWLDYILYDASWIDSDHFLIKITDRTSSIQSKQVISVYTREVEEINRVEAKLFGGWFDKYSPIVPVKLGYVDKVVYQNRTHLAYFEEALSKEPKLITSSPDWDVIDLAPVVYSDRDGILFTLANIKGPMDSHVIAVDLEGKIDFVLAQEREGSYSFDSVDGQYMTLEYKGPGIAWQKIINTREFHEQEDLLSYLEHTPMSSSYKEDKKNLEKYNLPTRVFKTVKVKGVEVDVLEILPPNFDPKKRKYPILVNAYGGPGSQTVKKGQGMGFEDIISAQLDAIVLQIDPRGTDGHGWKSKHYGLQNIGHWEPKDIITVVSEYIKKNKKSIKKDAVAIWGWSYGGFTALKTLEIDGGKTFKYGMAVAPVTNFLFYNSFYTERYMKSPADTDYTKNAMIGKYDSFKNLDRFLIMHGTADDNVHIQNLLWLIDKFNINELENYDLHFFTDSNHDINFHKAEILIYDKLLRWLGDAFRGKYKLE